MKKIMCALLLSLSFLLVSFNEISYKAFIENTNQELVRSRCEIIAGNAYDYCIKNGFSKDDACAIETATLNECQRLTEKKITSIY